MEENVGSSEPSRTPDSDQRFSSPIYYDLIAPIEKYVARVTALIDGVRPSEERRFLIETLDLQPGDRILEVAIGTGRNIPVIARYVGPKGELVGIDLSRAMLRRCQANVNKACTQSMLIEATASQLPLCSDQFDAVLHFGGMNSFSDRRGTIQEMMRIAKPYSVIVISDKSLPPITVSLSASTDSSTDKTPDYGSSAGQINPCLRRSDRTHLDLGRKYVSPALQESRVTISRSCIRLDMLSDRDIDTLKQAHSGLGVLILQSDSILASLPKELE